MRTLITLFTPLFSLAGPVFAGLLAYGAFITYDASKHFIKESSMNIVQLLSNDKSEPLSTTNTVSEPDLLIAAVDSDIQVEEFKNNIKNWTVPTAPLSPIEQAAEFLGNSKQVIQDGINQNRLSSDDIALITKTMLGGDIKEIAKLDEIYSRKNMVIIDGHGNTKKLVGEGNSMEIIESPSHTSRYPELD
ncbi:TPA: hypothetical protein ACGIK9_002901 [Acinetobacter baumannii]|uniref:hypothetical protein n=1 Tax=Acinetobacter baumannii TaxID=470 RepID=UPI00338D853A